MSKSLQNQACHMPEVQKLSARQIGFTCFCRALVAPGFRFWTCLLHNVCSTLGNVWLAIARLCCQASSAMLTIPEKCTGILNMSNIVSVAQATVAAVLFCRIGAAFLDRFGFLPPVTAWPCMGLNRAAYKLGWTASWRASQLPM